MEGDIGTTADRLADLTRRAERRPSTARERITSLLDGGSFVEIDALWTHEAPAVVAGFGTIDGRSVCVFGQDAAGAAGGLGQVHGEKIVKIIDLAMKTGAPLIGINEGEGARIQEGVASLGSYGEIFRRNTHASGVIPQISLIMGPAAGANAHSPALADFVIMVDGTSQLYLNRPDVIKTVSGEEVTAEDLGGGRTHSTVSGNAHYLAAGEEDAFDYVRQLLSYLPQNNLEDPPVYEASAPQEGVTDVDRELDLIIPDSPHQPYDMREVVTTVLDHRELCEVAELFAPNIVCGFGRVEGRSVGVVANQPMRVAGCLDIDASEKAARFVRTCDAFNIPVVTFVDVPGFLPGADQEQHGIVRRGAKLIFSYAEATVPLVTVIIRKAYGGAYAVMGSKHLGVDIVLAWPTARIGVVEGQGAVNLLHGTELAAHDDPETRRAELITAYDELASPYIAAGHGYVDAVIPPHRSRLEIGTALRLLRNKRETLPPKKHGNIPL